MAVIAVAKNKLCFVPQIENGKLSEHENSSTMEHLRLLLPMVLTMSRTRAEASGPGEWQEDGPGWGLYRGPGDGVTEECAAPQQSVDLDKKVSLTFNAACSPFLSLGF